MTASKTFGGVAGIGGAGERRRFESRRSLTYTINTRPQNMRIGRRMHDQWPPSRQRHAAALDDTCIDFRVYSISLENHFRKMGDVGCRCSRSRLFGTAKHQSLLTF
jgi:hypothetical protein